MTYRNDSVWKRAQETYINAPGDTSAERMVHRMQAAMVMYSREDAELTDAQRDRIAALLRAGAGGTSSPSTDRKAVVAERIAELDGGA